MTATGGGRSRPPVVVLDDEAVARSLDPDRAVRWMREAVTAAGTGAMTAPPRVGASLGRGRVVFTVGELTGTWFGYRSYDTFPDGPDGERSDQLVVVQSARSGAVEGIAVGNLLGQLRTGALGGVAVDLLARPDAETVGVIGSGAQAWSQVWAISAVRRLAHVRVHSRHPANAARFASRVERELGIACETSATAADAVRERDVVVLATSSGTAVVEAEWLAAGTHLTSVGSKQVGRSELGGDVLDRADLIATDSIAQLHAYDPPALGSTTRRSGDVVELGSLAPGAARAGDPGRTTLYLSVGLAGSEVHLLHRLLGSMPDGT